MKLLVHIFLKRIHEFFLSKSYRVIFQLLVTMCPPYFHDDDFVTTIHELPKAYYTFYIYIIMKKITIRAAKHLYICDSFKQGYGKYSIFLNYDLVMKKSKEGQFKIKL